MNCASCGMPNQTWAVYCSGCGKPIAEFIEVNASADEAPSVVVEVRKNTPVMNSLLITLGSTFMVLGTFMPIVSLPLVGSITYFNSGQGDGVVIMVLATIVALMAFTKAFRLAWIPASLACATLAITVTTLITKIAEAKTQLSESLEGNPFADLATGIAGSVQIQFGWVIVLIGICTSVFGAIYKFPPPEE